MVKMSLTLVSVKVVGQKHFINLPISYKQPTTICLPENYRQPSEILPINYRDYLPPTTYCTISLSISAWKQLTAKRNPTDILPIWPTTDDLPIPYLHVHQFGGPIVYYSISPWTEGVPSCKGISFILYMFSKSSLRSYKFKGTLIKYLHNWQEYLLLGLVASFLLEFLSRLWHQLLKLHTLRRKYRNMEFNFTEWYTNL